MAVAEDHALLQEDAWGSCARLAALERQDLYCTYHAHHVLKSIYCYYHYHYHYIIIVIIINIIIIIVIVIVIGIIIVIMIVVIIVVAVMITTIINDGIHHYYYYYAQSPEVMPCSNGKPIPGRWPSFLPWLQAEASSAC